MLKADDDFLMQRSVFSSEAEVIVNRGRTVFKTDEGEKCLHEDSESKTPKER